MNSNISATNIPHNLKLFMEEGPRIGLDYISIHYIKLDSIDLMEIVEFKNVRINLDISGSVYTTTDG